MSRPLNLASRPFRNEALPALLFALVTLLLVVVTVRHAVILARLRPGVATPQQREVAQLEAEAARLRAELADFRAPEPDAKTLPQWELIKGLVDQRALRWTELLAVLEETLPAGVRVVSLTPKVETGVVSLEMTVIARNAEAGLDLLPILEQRTEFHGVYPMNVGTQEDGTEYRYSMFYQPPAGAPASPPSSADAGSGAHDAGNAGGMPGRAQAAEAPIVAMRQ
jgi:Tfp pilus assembly protein PilN